MIPPFARLIFDHDRTYDMRKKNIIIGRGTTSSPVDIDVGPSAFVSRKHLELSWGLNVLRLKCNGKNGIFVDQKFKPYSSLAYTIPASCILRFPSTSICVSVKQCRRVLSKRRKLDSRCLSPNSYIKPTTGDSDLSEEFPDSPSIRRKSTCHLSSDTDQNTRELFVTDTSTSSCTTANFANDQSRTRRKQNLVPKDRITPVTQPQVQADADIPEAGSQDHGEVSQDGAVDRQFTEAANTEVAINDTPTGQSVTPPYSQPLPARSRILVASLSRLSQTSAPLPPQTLVRLTEMTTLERGDRETKPPYSYAQLIAQAITSQPSRQLTLSGIYDYISQNYPYYQPHDKGWQNSVRHNLSLNRYFIKIQRSQDDHGKGCFWRIDPTYEVKVMNLAFRKRHTRGCGALYLSTQPSASSLLTGTVRQLPFVPSGASLCTTRNLISQMQPNMKQQVIELRPTNTAGHLRLSIQSTDSARSVVPVNIVASPKNPVKPGNICYHVIKPSNHNLPQSATVGSQLDKPCDPAKPACLLVFRQIPNTIVSVNTSENATTEQLA